MENDKFVSLGTLNKLAKELRQKSLTDIEQQEESIQRVEDMLSGKSLKYITQEEYNNLSEEEKNRMDIVWNIVDADECFSGDYNDLINKPEIPSIDGLATEEYVNSTITALVDSAPAAMDTLNELATAIKDNKSVYDGYVAEHAQAMAKQKSDLQAEIDADVKIVADALANEVNVQKEGSLARKINAEQIRAEAIETDFEERIMELESDTKTLKDFKANHTHDGLQASKVNESIKIQLNGGTSEGSTQFTFNGSAAKTINITPNSIGAAASSHGTHLTLGETISDAYRGDRGKAAYDHSKATHAPTNAQKNSDITKAEIEAKLTGNITSHTHNQYLTSHQDISSKADKTTVDQLSTEVNTIKNNLGGISLQKLSQSAYDALSTKDPNTLYIII